MRNEYKEEFEQICIMVPKKEKAALRNLLSQKKMTQLNFIRGAYWLLSAGEFERIAEILKQK